MRRSLVFIALVVSLVVTASAGAAAPRYIIVSGSPLSRQVLLSDWHENFELIYALQSGRVAHGWALHGLRTRPRLRLALFWQWPDGTPPPTKASEASQTGWFYPAYGEKPATVHMHLNGIPAPRIVPTKALRIFTRYGVPTRLPLSS